MLSDVRHAFRLFTRCRGFAATAVSMVALGIGATTAIFSIVDAAVLRPLPYPEPDRLVAFRYVTPQGPSTGAAPRAFLDWRENQDVFEAVAATSGIALTLIGGREPEELRAGRATADFFDVYRVRPALGRVFSLDDERPGADRIAVIANGFWQRRFAGASDVVGRALVTDRGSYEIVGVLPEWFTWPVGRTLDVLVPLAFSEADRQYGTTQSAFLGVAGRLKKGEAIEQAAARMNVLHDRFEDRRVAFNKVTRIDLEPMHELVTRGARSWMLMLLGSVGFVLLIACVNVASLFLAHGVDRVRELTVRAALGASPWRIARQMFAETLVIAAAGGMLGLALAWWSVELLRSSVPSSVPRSATIGIDLRVLAFTGVAAIATALVSGLAPALSGARTDVAIGLKEGARATTGGRGRRRLGQLLAFAEVVLALVLLVGAGLFIRSFVRVMTIDTGLDTSNVYAMDVSIPSRPDAAPVRVQLAAGILEQVRTVPGVAGAAIGGGLRPFAGGYATVPFTIDGDESGARHTDVIVRAATPGYLTLLGVPVRRGRGIDARDTASAPPVAVLNESAARLLFARSSPIGRRVRFDAYAPEIVGVVADARSFGPEHPPAPEIYLPYEQQRLTSVGLGSSLVFRVTGEPESVVAAVKAKVLALVPGKPVTAVAPVNAAVRRATAPRRFNMALMTIFGVVALGIAATGIYGLMAYTVRRRTHEIGVRLALGARASDVTLLVLRQGALVIGLGIVAGLGAAWLLARTVQSFLFEIDARDPMAFGSAAAVIAAAGLVACWRPVHRASRVDPVVALRRMNEDELPARKASRPATLLSVPVFLAILCVRMSRMHYHSTDRKRAKRAGRSVVSMRA